MYVSLKIIHGPDQTDIKYFYNGPLAIKLGNICMHGYALMKCSIALILYNIHLPQKIIKYVKARIFMGILFYRLKFRC